MNNIEVLIKKLVCIDGARLHSNIAPHPKDIDIYLPRPSISEAITILEESQFICIDKTNYHFLYAKFIDGNPYFIDFCWDYSYYFSLFPSIKFSKLGNNNLGNGVELNRSVKKLSNLKNLDGNDINLLKEFFADSANFLKLPKGSYLDYQDFNNLIITISRKRKLNIFITRLKILFKNFKKGRSFAFIGPDGSGKGFFIDKLIKAYPAKIIYMGDWFFSFQRIYTLLLKLPSPINRFLYFFYYFENLIRRIRVFFWNMIGKHVFIDRFPGTNSPVALNGFASFMNSCIFWLTPKPSIFIILLAPPEVVFKRKQELSIKQIDLIQKGQLRIVSDYNHCIIETENLDHSLNYLLNELYADKK